MIRERDWKILRTDLIELRKVLKTAMDSLPIQKKLLLLYKLPNPINLFIGNIAE
jgi:hypothetical protein